MADPLSITTSVMGVVTAVFQSCKTLNDLVSSCKNAPKNLRDLRYDLNTLQNLIKSLERVVAGPARGDLSLEQRSCILELVPAMESCQKACDDFIQRLANATSHSKGAQVSLADRLRLYLNEGDIQALKSRLGVCKQTLDIALGVVTLSATTDNREKLQAFETEVATALSGFTGQIQGIELAIQALQLKEPEIHREDVAQVIQFLNEHDRVLKQCLRVCALGLEETTSKTGTAVRYAETFDKARQLIGNIGNVGSGGPETTVERAQASNESRMVIGNTDAEFARNFLC